MEQTERTLQPPGEESASLPEAGMREWNAHYLSLETLGFCPTQGANSGIRRRGARGWATWEPQWSYDWATKSTGEQGSEPLEEAKAGRVRRGGKMQEKSCTTVLLVDFSSWNTSFLKSLWFPLGRERIRSRRCHMERRSSTVWASLSQVSTSLSPLPPNKNFINLEIFVSGQFQRFLLELPELSKIPKEDRWFKLAQNESEVMNYVGRMFSSAGIVSSEMASCTSIDDANEKKTFWAFYASSVWRERPLYLLVTWKNKAVTRCPVHCAGYDTFHHPRLRPSERGLTWNVWRLMSEHPKVRRRKAFTTCGHFPHLSRILLGTWRGKPRYPLKEKKYQS